MSLEATSGPERDRDNPAPPPPHRIDPAALRESLSAVVVDFFEAYGVSCVVPTTEETSAEPSCAELGSIAALRGKAVQGGLAFVAPLELVAHVHPAPHDAGTDRHLRDWCGEMANQILGRLKNKLVAKGVDFEVGTPVCFTGRSIRLVFPPDAEGVSLAFVAGSWPVRVHLDFSLQPGAISPPTARVRIVAEGEVLLF